MHEKNPGYKAGDYWMVCDRCGFDYRRSQMRQEWTGLWVCEADWEPRHPQDFAQAKPDTIVPDPVRPVAENQFDPGSDNDVSMTTIVGTHGGTISDTN